MQLHYSDIFRKTMLFVHVTNFCVVSHVAMSHGAFLTLLKILKIKKAIKLETFVHNYYIHLSLYLFIVNAVVTELSCFSGPCVPQTVQYHCETNASNLLWLQGSITLGGIVYGITSTSQDGYNITIVPKDGGGLTSNISFMADGNNGTTIHCVDYTAGFDSTYHCLLIIGEFYT